MGSMKNNRLAFPVPVSLFVATIYLREAEGGNAVRYVAFSERSKRKQCFSFKTSPLVTCADHSLALGFALRADSHLSPSVGYLV